MDDKDRNAIIEYRLQQAIDTIELVKFLINNDKLAIAINRIYYGMFYALSALALKTKFETSKHGQLIGWFNKVYIASKRIDSKFGIYLRNAFQIRTKGDYDAFVNFSRPEVEIMYIEMIAFIEEIKKVLNK